MSTPTIVLAIDPSICAMGWAILQTPLSHESHIGSGCFKQDLDPDIEKANVEVLHRINTATELVHTLVLRYRPSYLVIEQPEIFGSGKGQAANNSGAVLKLSALAFSIYASCRCCFADKLKVHMRKVSEWKGQTPKSITQARVRRDVGVYFSDHNQMDAIGIGRDFIKRVLPKLRNYAQR